MDTLVQHPRCQNCIFVLCILFPFYHLNFDLFFYLFFFGWMIDSLSQKHQKFRDFRPKFAEFSAILLEFCEFSRSWEPAGSGAGFLENYWILLIFIEICCDLLKFIGNYWNSLNFQWICNGIHWNSLESNRFSWKSIVFSIKKPLKNKGHGLGTRGTQVVCWGDEIHWFSTKLLHKKPCGGRNPSNCG